MSLADFTVMVSGLLWASLLQPFALMGSHPKLSEFPFTLAGFHSASLQLIS